MVTTIEIAASRPLLKLVAIATTQAVPIIFGDFRFTTALCFFTASGIGVLSIFVATDTAGNIGCAVDGITMSGVDAGLVGQGIAMTDHRLHLSTTPITDFSSAITGGTSMTPMRAVMVNGEAQAAATMAAIIPGMAATTMEVIKAETGPTTEVIMVAAMAAVPTATGARAERIRRITIKTDLPTTIMVETAMVPGTNATAMTMADNLMDQPQTPFT